MYGTKQKIYNATLEVKQVKCMLKTDLFHPGVFILHNKSIPYLRNKLHLQDKDQYSILQAGNYEETYLDLNI